MKATITTSELKNIGNKIVSISEKVGMSNVTHFKVFSQAGFDGITQYYVVTRQGILNFFGDAQRACCYGKKGIDYNVFKKPADAIKFINA